MFVVLFGDEAVPVGLFTTLKDAKLSAYGRLKVIAVPLQSSNDEVGDEAVFIYWFDINGPYRKAIGWYYIEDNYEIAWHQCSKLRSRKEPLTQLAYDILSGDPIARAAAQDTLAGRN